MGPAEEAVVARASPPGSGFRALLRASGRDVLAAVGRAVGVPALAGTGGGRVVTGRLDLGAWGRVPVRCLVFRAPRSYTGEDLVEIHLPGHPLLVARALERLYAEGLRPAAPGEFTRRAVLNGRLDLLRAAGVGALVAATSEAERRAALRLTGGELTGRLERVRTELVALLADLEGSLDFPEHEVPPDAAADAAPRLAGLRAALEAVAAALGQTAGGGPLPQVFLWGRPNAGKSTLCNALLGRARARVAAAPGTTRDVLTGRLLTPGGPVLLADAPGWGPAAAGAAARAARQRARAAAGEADLILVVADGADPAPPPPPPPGRPCLLVVTKTDRPPRLDAAPWVAAHRPAGVCRVSARTGRGLGQLLEALGAWRARAAAGAEGGTAAARLREQVGRAAAHLDEAAGVASRGGGEEVVALLVREALAALEELLGRVVSEEVLSAVFRRFCIGK